MHASHNFLTQHGVGTGVHGAVTHYDEIAFFQNVDTFLCLLAAPVGGGGERYWPVGLGVRSRYLERLMRGVDEESGVRVERWVEVGFEGRMGVGGYAKVVDGFLGVLEGRVGDPVVERAMRDV